MKNKPKKTHERLALEAQFLKYPPWFMEKIMQLVNSHEAQHGPGPSRSEAEEETTE